MNDSTPTSGAWTRIFIAIAVIYGVLVAFAVWSRFPTRDEIEADTATSAIVAVSQHEAKYKGMPPDSLRRRLYRGLTDEQVIARVREYAATEEQRVRTQAGRITVDAAEGGMGLFGGSLAKPEEQPSGVGDAGMMRPQIAVVMEDLDKRHADRLVGLRAEQTRAIVWGVAAWVLPLIVLYVVGPRLARRPRKSLSRL